MSGWNVRPGRASILVGFADDDRADPDARSALVDQLAADGFVEGALLTVNEGDGDIVETTPAGAQVATKTLYGTGGGGRLPFGLVIRPGGTGVWFVDYGTNTLAPLH
jgi:hypothetical protein